MYTVDFAYDALIFLAPLSLSNPSTPVLITDSLPWTIGHPAISLFYFFDIQCVDGSWGLGWNSNWEAGGGKTYLVSESGLYEAE